MGWFTRRQGEAPLEVSEQREFARIRMILGVVCRQRGQDFNIFTDDVSRGGIRFISQHPVFGDESATLFIMLDPDQKAVSIRGQVMWVQEESPQRFTGGIQFKDVGPAVEKSWLDFIDRNKS
jgi:hypothetical protein